MYVLTNRDYPLGIWCLDYRHGMLNNKIITLSCPEINPGLVDNDKVKQAKVGFQTDSYMIINMHESADMHTCLLYTSRCV